jgi:Rps23 Pro-64 3,4-dihydroxylase Tpa1-like proline 4-hydroxylase
MDVSFRRALHEANSSKSWHDEFTRNGFVVLDLNFTEDEVKTIQKELESIPDENWLHRLWFVGHTPLNISATHPRRQLLIDACHQEAVAWKKDIDGQTADADYSGVPYHYKTVLKSDIRENMTKLMDELASPTTMTNMSQIVNSTLYDADRCGMYLSKMTDGDFVSLHDDRGKMWNLGFVLNLTTNDDSKIELNGGELCLVPKTNLKGQQKLQKDVSDGCYTKVAPKFGRLTLMQLPLWHRVNTITSKTMNRYAISGNFKMVTPHLYGTPVENTCGRPKILTHLYVDHCDDYCETQTQNQTRQCKAQYCRAQGQDDSGWLGYVGAGIIGVAFVSLCFVLSHSGSNDVVRPKV